MCYLCRRFILLPMYPVRTLVYSPLEGGSRGVFSKTILLDIEHASAQNLLQRLSHRFRNAPGDIRPARVFQVLIGVHVKVEFG